jgi:hypothetical protein
MKKNIQRQEGLKIVDNIDDVIKNDGDYVLAQELLMNTYLVNERKINLRVYIAVISKKDNINVFMFNDGFIYYSKNNFDSNDLSNENNITTGYVERDVYEINPLTHSNFKQYLDMMEGEKYHIKSKEREYNDVEKNIVFDDKKISDVVFKNIENMMKDVFISMKGKICKEYHHNKKVNIYNDISMQLFGADVGIDKNLNPVLIEINKGPDLSPKDERDGSIKKKLMYNLFEIVGLKELSKDNGFKKILSM